MRHKNIFFITLLIIFFMFLGSSASAKVNYYEPTYSTDPWADIDSYDWLFQISYPSNNFDTLYYLQPSGTSGYLTPDGNLTLFAVYNGGSSESEKYDLIVINDLATRNYSFTSKRRSNGNYYNGNTSNISVFTIDYLKERLNNNIYDTSCKNVGPLVFNPKYCKIFASQEDYKEYILNYYGNDPDAPEIAQPKITLSTGDYYLIDTDKQICGVLNADSEYYFYNKQKTDIELFLIDTDPNDNKFILNSENVNAVKYSPTGQYLDEQTVKIVTLNRSCKPFLMRTYLNNNINFIPHNSCLSIDKASIYSDFTLVAPSQPALLRYLLNDLSDGEDDTFPVFPVPEDTPDPVDPTPIDIPDEWGFLGDLFDSFVGTANQLLNSIKSNLKSLSNTVGEGFDSLSSGISSFKNSVIDGISSLASDIGDSVSNGISNVLKDLFIPEDGFLNDRISSIRNKFSFADTIYNTAQGLFNLFNTISGNNAPSITVHLSSKSSGASYGQKDVVISLDWYAPYKPTIDALLSGILWAGYIWLIIKRVPDLIKGSGMITENLLSINKK